MPQSGPPTLLEDIEKRAKDYLDNVDNGKLIYPACKRTVSDAHGDEPSICDHTRLEACRYLLSVPRREFTLLADPDAQTAVLDAYLRQLPHDDTVIEFTGNATADLAIAVIAGFNWLNHCAGLAGADRRQFSGTLNHFRKIAVAAQRWWATEGAKERCAEMLQARQEPPLFLNLIWADYTRLAGQIAAARAAG
ncbi:MAG TPA: hypothetical protein VKR55_13465 [Bradyrhizobium sp.]|uniref:hypothetical protein n=1 Tax=Bradyrhizobium sp. TaxID=376 RepID=UPI002B816357|nr:hypothetical protein [Bradyrhizobium sp.]HLZ03141.1 hypothetical protein [Bradyrhizobium sp.]